MSLMLADCSYDDLQCQCAQCLPCASHPPKTFLQLHSCAQKIKEKEILDSALSLGKLWMLILQRELDVRSDSLLLAISIDATSD